MIDVRLLETDKDTVVQSLTKRGLDAGGILAELEELNNSRRQAQTEVDGFKAERNRQSKEIGKLIKDGANPAELKQAMKELGDKIKEYDQQIAELRARETELLLEIPNLLDAQVPQGKDENDNQLVREWGEKPSFDFKPKPHWDILDDFGLVDFDRGAKIAGSKFYVYRALVAKLERALTSFMLETHSAAGFEEIAVPVLVNNDSMTGTGQFPKFKDEYYTLERDELSLIPTAEVPITNFYRDDILSYDELPIAFTAATSCFRREAGAAGRDTRGLTRVHQFQKVEMVIFCRPEQSDSEHERLLSQAEKILQELGLHYRVMLLCGGDTSAASGKTYDLEVWMPGQDRYVEISSVSNFFDFQARRAKIRYKGGEQKKPALVHTLNGSGLALGRTVAAILENYQTTNGSFDIPKALKTYATWPS